MRAYVKQRIAMIREERKLQRMFKEDPSAAQYYQRVYVIPCGELVKIGVAADVNQRWRALRIANPLLEPVIYVTQPLGCATRVESEAHRILSACHVDGEWFRCDAQRAIEVVRSLELKVIGIRQVI